MGLNATLTTFAPNTVIASSAVNANLAALNNADTIGLIQPPTLLAGNQETGACGMGNHTTNTPAGAAFSYMQNFKTVLTNTPTSITLTPNTQTNVTSVAAGTFLIYGFSFVLTVNAANTQSFWYGTYTTVGNCLLAVDTVARTFDHHCDVCGNVTRGTPFADLAVSASIGSAPGVLQLTYTCAVCGAVECFNTSMGSAEESDTTPQGSGAYITTRGEQAQWVRALQVALGYTVNA